MHSKSKVMTLDSILRLVGLIVRLSPDHPIGSRLLGEGRQCANHQQYANFRENYWFLLTPTYFTTVNNAT
jgi:hypothetical protein